MARKKVSGQSCWTLCSNHFHGQRGYLHSWTQVVIRVTKGQLQREVTTERCQRELGSATQFFNCAPSSLIVAFCVARLDLGNLATKKGCYEGTWKSFATRASAWKMRSFIGKKKKKINTLFAVHRLKNTYKKEWCENKI